MPDIFADALRAKLQEFQHSLISLHLSCVRKEHEELTQEVADLRKENRDLHERASHPHTWKGTKALRSPPDDHSKDRHMDLPGMFESAQPSDDAHSRGAGSANAEAFSSAEDAVGGSAASFKLPSQTSFCSQISRASNHQDDRHHLSLDGVMPDDKAGARAASPAVGANTSSSTLEGQPSHLLLPQAASPPQPPAKNSLGSEADTADSIGRFPSKDALERLHSNDAVERLHSKEDVGRRAANLLRPGQGRQSQPDKTTVTNFQERDGDNAEPDYMTSLPIDFVKTRSWGLAASLPAGSKASHNNIEALPVWVQTFSLLERDHHMGARHSHVSHLSFGSRPEDFHFEHDEEEENTMSAIVKVIMAITVQPLSGKRIFWDVVSLIFIAWDMFFIPLKLFNPPEWKMVAVMLWVTRLFWTFDLPLSFLTGLLMNDGNIEMHPDKIARRYTRTWLFPDMVMVLCDWLEVLVQIDVHSPFRLIRLLRLYRLARILRIPESLTLIGEKIWSEQVLLVASFIKIVGLVLGVAHLIACFWYGVSQVKGYGNLNWVHQHDFEDSSVFERYAMSFHWSLTQFVGGMDIIQPHNISERVYAIFIVLLTFVISAAVVSSITSSMTRLQFLAGNRAAQLSSLHRYLMDHRISRKLMMRIQRNAEHAMIEKQRNLPEAQVELLHVISEPLRVELHFEEHSPILSNHPFFELYSELCPAGMRKVCHQCVSTKVLWPGDVLFSHGETPTFPQMYFICSGTLQYQPYLGAVAAHVEKDPLKVHVGNWACEGVLWVRWVHRGMLRVSTDAKLIAVSATDFQEITCQFNVHNGFHPGFYAAEFVNHLTTTPGVISDLGDRLETERVMAKTYERIHSYTHNSAQRRTRGSIHSIASRHESGMFDGGKASIHRTFSSRKRTKSILGRGSMIVSSMPSLTPDGFHHSWVEDVQHGVRDAAHFVNHKVTEVVSVIAGGFHKHHSHGRSSRRSRQMEALNSNGSKDASRDAVMYSSEASVVVTPMVSEQGAHNAKMDLIPEAVPEHHAQTGPVSTDGGKHSGNQAPGSQSQRTPHSLTEARPTHPEGSPAIMSIERCDDEVTTLQTLSIR